MDKPMVVEQDVPQWLERLAAHADLVLMTRHTISKGQLLRYIKNLRDNLNESAEVLRNEHTSVKAGPPWDMLESGTYVWDAEKRTLTTSTAIADATCSIEVISNKHSSPCSCAEQKKALGLREDQKLVCTVCDPKPAYHADDCGFLFDLNPQDCTCWRSTKT